MKMRINWNLWVSVAIGVIVYTIFGILFLGMIYYLVERLSCILF